MDGSISIIITTVEVTIVISNITYCAGPPLAPSVHLTVWHLGSDSFIFTLNWSTTFTWSGFPIISYNITMTNYSNEQPTTTVNITESNINHIEYTGRGSGCHTLTFSIEANNSIGRGDRALIYSAQPIGKAKINVVAISQTHCYYTYQL